MDLGGAVLADPLDVSREVVGGGRTGATLEPDHPAEHGE
jgi:hypothetical protein